MIEILLAAMLPALLVWIGAGHSRFSVETRRAVRWWFVPAVLIWFAPFWISGGSPGGFDYLFREIVPWRDAAPRTANALLSDSVLQFVPWREAARTSIAQGAMPFLNRYAGSGAPLWENPQAALAYPLMVAGLPFSGFAWPLFASIAKTLIALTGMYAFLRGRGMVQEGAIFGAFAWSFSAFSIAFLQFPHTNVTVLVPWLLVAIDACVTSGRAVWGMAAVLAMMVLGGHPESVLHAALIAIPLAAINVFSSHGRVAVAKRYLLGGVCGLALAAPLLIPFAQYLPHTERVARLADQREVIAAPPLNFHSLMPFAFAGHVVPTLYPPTVNFAEVATQYVGLAAFAFALFAAIVDWRRPFWTVVFVVSATFAFSTPLAETVLSRIPVISISMNGRFRLLVAFAAAVLAAKGVSLLRGREKQFAIVALSVMAAVAIAVFVSWDEYGPFAGRVLACAIAAFAGGAGAVAAGLAGLRHLLPIALFIDLTVMLMPYHPVARREAFYPATGAVEFLQRQPKPLRITGAGFTLLPNSGAMVGLEDIGVHDPVGYAPYLDMLGQGGYDRRSYHLVFPDIPHPALLQALAVRYVVTPPGVTTSALRTAYSGPDAVVLEVPRKDARVTVAAGATIEEVAYSPNTVRIVVNASAQSWVGSGEVALPGWRLYRNGEEWPFAESLIPLLSWNAPAGRSEFELRYRPAGLGTGLMVCVLGLLLLVATRK